MYVKFPDAFLFIIRDEMQSWEPVFDWKLGHTLNILKATTRYKQSHATSSLKSNVKITRSIKFNFAQC